jgi:hypothetical protein
MHKYLEDYVSDGVEIPDDNIAALMARQLVPYLPTHNGKVTEAQFELPFGDEGNKFFVGFIDLVSQSPQDGVALIRATDYKSTSGLGWALSKNKLASNEQALIYAKYLAGDSRHVELQWLYSECKKGFDKPTGKREVLITLDTQSEQCKQDWQKILDDSHRLLALRKQGDVQNTVQNFYNCKAYGGCFFSEKCTKSSNLQGFMQMFNAEKKETSKMDMEKMMANIKARQAITTSSTTIPEEKVLEVAEAEPEIIPESFLKVDVAAALDPINPPPRALTPEEEDIKTDLEAQDAEDEVELPEPANAKPIDEYKSWRKSELLNYVRKAISINVLQSIKKQELLKIIEEHMENGPIVSDIPVPEDAEEQACNAGTDMPPLQEASLESVQNASNKETKSREDLQGVSLIVVYGLVVVRTGCASQDVIYLDDVLTKYKDNICKANGVEHWSLVEYGRGPGLLCAYLEDWFREIEPKGVLVCDPLTKEAQAVRDVLNRHADYIAIGG